MREIIILLGVIFIVAPVRAERPAVGEMEIKIKGMEDKSIYAKTKAIELKNLISSEIEPFIRSRLSIYGAVQVNDALNTIIITDMEPKLSDLVKFVKDLDAKGVKEFVRLETETIHPKYVLPSKLDSILISNLSPDGSIQTDDDLNAIMITDVRSRIDRIKEILEKLDIPPKQVLIEGKIATMDYEWLQKVGIHIPSLIGQGEIGGRITFEDSKVKIEGIGVIPFNFSGLIDQAVSEGKATIKSLPTVVVQNNRQGTISLTEPDVMLSLIPQIGSVDFITLNISFYIQVGALLTEPELVEAHIPEEWYARAEAAAMRARRRPPSGIGRGVKTSVMVKDESSFIIGGVEFEENTLVERGVPLLRSIPLIGWLFKRRATSTSKKEVFVIITPHILEFGESPKREEEK